MLDVYARLRRALPPVRLLIVALVILGAVSSFTLGGLGVPSLLLFPAVACATDLLFQRVRFDKIRAPEPAIATGLFLALLLPPTVSLLPACVLVVVAVGVRHSLRLRGRPWLNPAASGLLLGAVLFGMAPAWWAAVSPGAEVLVVVLGAFLALRQPGRWRLPVTFFAVYGLLAVLEHFLVGGALSPRILALDVLDPVVLFFGLFMVTEPRTAPTSPSFQPVYATLVALGAVFLPIYLPTLGVLVALFIGNLVSFAHRGVGPAPAPAPAPLLRGSRRERRKQERLLARSRARAAARWPVSYRVGTLAVMTLMLAVVVSASSGGPSNTPSTIISGTGGGTGIGGGGGGVGGGNSGGGGGVGYSNCQQDNPAIPASTAQQLHKALGPSVLLSYDPNTGVVVFYDPVNQVTVTETDLYEDYGFAEFNGDDYAVSGCSP